MDFKTYVINIFKKLYDQIENLSRELKSIKVNHENSNPEIKNSIDAYNSIVY